MMWDSATITELETVLRLVHVEHTHCMAHANQLISRFTLTIIIFYIDMLGWLNVCTDWHRHKVYGNYACMPTQVHLAAKCIGYLLCRDVCVKLMLQKLIILSLFNYVYSITHACSIYSAFHNFKQILMFFFFE